MVVLELALIVGGVIFLKNRKKRKAEARARQEAYGSRPGSVSPPPPPQNYTPYAPPATPVPQQKPPVMYGATTASGPSQPRPYTPNPPYPDGYPSYAPPAYASVQPQNDAPPYERQGQRVGDGDRKSRGLFR
ncbi:hypothetical protein TWF696_001308 [Orbilia brochopaga]|uniref:Uncharacterized protein n=1 Tax=Orbilia brochopaga TaxID=3140254 RepID=A0AAV9UBV8_9PEZI